MYSYFKYDIEISLQKYKKNDCLWFFESKEFDAGMLTKQKSRNMHCTFLLSMSWRPYYDYPATVNLALPLARRAASTFLPFLVAILERKPCLFLLFLFEGWNVLFILSDVLFVAELLGCKSRNNFWNIQFIGFKILFGIVFFLILL